MLYGWDGEIEGKKGDAKQVKSSDELFFIDDLYGGVFQRFECDDKVMTILDKRYLATVDGEKETPEEMFFRVAKHIGSALKARAPENASKDEINHHVKGIIRDFYDMMVSKKFLPNSPCLMNAGLGQTLSACFVCPVDDSMESIFQTLKDAALIFKEGGGVGFSFSRLRPSNDVVKSTSGISSGPVSFMKIYDAAIEQVKQGGKRRGAAIGTLRVDHPDIIEFINCKTKEGDISNINISVGITDEFMDAVRNDKNYWLVNPRNKEKVQELSARYVFNMIAENAWKNGEPGVLFLDTINKANPLPELGEIETTNPCLTGDMKLLTTEGYIPLRDLAGKDNIEIINKDNEVVKSKVFFSGVKDTVKIVLSSGEIIRCTPDHKFMTTEGPCEAKDLCGKRLRFLIDSAGTVLVKKVYPSGKEEVFDFTEPKTHWGVVEGLITHNCGEIPLLPYGSCCLGSINVSKFVTEEKKVNLPKLQAIAFTAATFLDHLIQVNHYPLPQIEEFTTSARQIGLGVMGFADLLSELGVPYNSSEARGIAKDIMMAIKVGADSCSKLLGASCDVGPFSLIDKSIYKGEQRRFSATTCIAPTGTISAIAGCSSGIEPHFALGYTKNVLDGEQLIYYNEQLDKLLKDRGLYTDELKEQIAKEGSLKNTDLPDDIKNRFLTSLEISPEDHIKMQATFQTNGVDQSISKTINLPSDATVDDVKEAYMKAHDLECKGLTVYRDKSREVQVIDIGQKDGNVKVVDKKIVPRPRPKIAHGFTEGAKSGCGKLLVTVNDDDQGLCEIIVETGKSGGCKSQSEALGRLASIALRANVSEEEIIDQLKGIRCAACVKVDGAEGLSCPDIIARIIKGTIKDKREVKEVEAPCPDCGSLLIRKEGCVSCEECGYSKCK